MRAANADRVGPMPPRSEAVTHVGHRPDREQRARPEVRFDMLRLALEARVIHRPRLSVVVLLTSGVLALACGPLEGLMGGSSTDTFSGGEGGGSSEPREIGEKFEPPEPTASEKAKMILQGVNSDLPWPGAVLSSSQCNDLRDGGDLKGPGDCVTDVIECDQSIIGHTRGGVKRFNTRWYERNFCTPATTQHQGGNERVYKFRFPDDGEWRAWFTLDTPCTDLDLFVIQWDDTSCPGDKTNVNECDAQVKDGTARERAEAVSDGNWVDWLVVVEAKDGEDPGAFGLTAQCRRGLR